MKYCNPVYKSFSSLFSCQEYIFIQKVYYCLHNAQKFKRLCHCLISALCKHTMKSTWKQFDMFMVRPCHLTSKGQDCGLHTLEYSQEEHHKHKSSYYSCCRFLYAFHLKSQEEIILLGFIESIYQKNEKCYITA